MQWIRLASLLGALCVSLISASGWTAEILLISRFPPLVGAQPGPDAPLIQTLESAGYQVNTFFMGNVVRPPRFDAAMLDAVNRADAILISPYDPMVDAFMPGCNFLGPLSASSQFTAVARPLVSLTATTPLEQIPTLVANAISGAPHPPVAYAVSSVGDFDEDGVYGVSDFALMFDAIRSPTPDERFDVSGSGTVDYWDLQWLVNDIYKTWWGDANLDGVFSTGDLVTVFQVGKYESGMHAHWGEGDWEGDGVFNSTDLVHFLANSAGYCPGPRAAVAVPEPMSVGRLVVGIALWCLVIRSRPS
jgi:hypothetical protein